MAGSSTVRVGSPADRGVSVGDWRSPQSSCWELAEQVVERMTHETHRTGRVEQGVVLIDHGSRREASNQLLLDVVDLFRRSDDYRIVEPAHMEIAAPSLETAFERCVRQGAELVIIHPYFLMPGRHWYEDIPALAAAAARHHPGISYLITAPLGVHPLMAEVIRQRIDDCLAQAEGRGSPCGMCNEERSCRIETVRSDGDPIQSTPK